MTTNPDQYRAEFDAEVRFANGGGLVATGFRVDVPSAQVSEAEVATLFVASLALLMVDEVDLHRLRLFAEPHKGTRGGPSDPATASAPPASWQLVELSHPIAAGMVTYPGLPGPEITAHVSREQSRGSYTDGVEFAIDRINLVGNTGSYLDSPRCRYPEGTDLAGLPLDAFADLPAIVVRLAGSGGGPIAPAALAALDLAGSAVLLHTGADQEWGSATYGEHAPYLTADAARLVVERGARLVGIDGPHIDNVEDRSRPAHSLLLAAGIPIVEHLTGLAQLPPLGARFTAAPPAVRNVGTFPVRAFASIPAS